MVLVRSGPRLTLNHLVLVRIQVRQPRFGPVLWGFFHFWVLIPDPRGPI
jgi:hypothetical protein